MGSGELTSQYGLDNVKSTTVGRQGKFFTCMYE